MTDDLKARAEALVVTARRAIDKECDERLSAGPRSLVPCVQDGNAGAGFLSEFADTITELLERVQRAEQLQRRFDLLWHAAECCVSPNFSPLTQTEACGQLEAVLRALLEEAKPE